MTQQTSARAPATLGRAAGIDLGIVVFGVTAVILSFMTGQRVATWHNAAIAPVVFLLAAITMRLVVAELRTLMRVLPETPHRGEAIAALVVALVAMVVVGPMLLIMPFVFLGAVT
jgi:hypothetical protein